MMDIEVATEAPTLAWQNLLGLNEAKLHLRILSDYQDQVVASAVEDAVGVCDYTNSEIRRCILPRSFKFYRTKWPTLCRPDGFYGWTIPYPPLVTVTAIKYRDSAGAEQTLAGTNYVVRKKSDMPGEIVFPDVSALPTIDSHPRAVTIEFTAGYGQAGAPPVPRNLIRLIKLLVGHYFENAEASVTEPRLIMMNRMVDMGAKHLIDSLRVPHEYRDWE